jgi:hypothetical protein
MRAGRQRWLEEMRAKKAAGEIDRFPGGRKSGPGWVTPRMWEMRSRTRFTAPPRRLRRGRPTLIEQMQAQTLRALAQLPEHSPLLARLAPHLARVAETRRDLERRARRMRLRPEF